MGSGYQLHDRGIVRIDTPIGEVQAMESIAVNNQDGSKQVLMFLYIVEGKQIQTTAKMHTTMMWQTLFGESGRPSYFLRFRQMTNGDDEESALN